MKYVHTNIVGENLTKLVDFYIKVFECKQVRSESKLMGDWLEKGTGVKNAQIRSVELKLPGFEQKGPILEIFEYSEITDRQRIPIPNNKGLGHLAFKVENVQEVLKKVLENGGGQIGELVKKEFKSGVLIFAYVTDPEGNIIEIQSWDPNP